MYVKLLEKFLKVWDITFTWLDNTQLRLWHKLNIHLENKKHGN